MQPPALLLPDSRQAEEPKDTLWLPELLRHEQLPAQHGLLWLAGWRWPEADHAPEALDRLHMAMPYPVRPSYPSTSIQAPQCPSKNIVMIGLGQREVKGHSWLGKSIIDTAVE